MKILKRAVKSGFVVLIENVQETINVALEPLLNKQVVKKGPYYYITLDNDEIDYNSEFLI